MGAVVGLAITSTTFNNKLSTYLTENLAGLQLPPDFNPAVFVGAPAEIHKAPIPEPVRDAIIHSFVMAIQVIFFCVVPLSAVLVLCGLGVKKQRLPVALRGAPPAAA
ncbi:hypothetical protein HK104_007898 [Borealophlyctis nickersoniae]|nr:hypothetical protein HK104_007898 [Borealophlyctis nickersoniae]